jgi:hypothetical protein
MRLFLIFVVCVVGSVLANENGKGREANEANGHVETIQKKNQTKTHHGNSVNHRGITQPLKKNKHKKHKAKYHWSLHNNRTLHAKEHETHPSNPNSPNGALSSDPGLTQVWHSGQVVGFNYGVTNILWNTAQHPATNYADYYAALMADPSWATWISGNYSVPGWTIPTAGPYAAFTGTKAFTMAKGKTTDAKIRQQINTWLQNGNLTANYYYNFYAVHLSKDVTISGFCSSWCAYHDFFTASGSRVNGQVYYAIFPFGGSCARGCLYPNDQTDISSTKMAISHEIAEYLTDPFWAEPQGGWWDSYSNEIADYCGWYGYPNVPPFMNGLPINYLWSNLDGGCISPPNATGP